MADDQAGGVIFESQDSNQNSTSSNQPTVDVQNQPPQMVAMSDANLVPLSQIKRLKLESLQDVVTTTQRLLSAVSPKSNELFWEDKQITLKLQSGETVLRTTNDWADPKVTADRNQYLLASDVVQFSEELGKWIVNHTNELQKDYGLNIDPSVFARFVQNPNEHTLVRRWGREQDSGYVDLLQLVSANNLQTLLRIKQALGQVALVTNRLPLALEEADSDTQAASDQTDDETATQQAALMAELATAKVVPPAENAGKAEEAGKEVRESAAEQPQQIAEETAVQERLAKKFTNSELDKRDRQRAVNHEFSWIYNHVLFDLMGRHGVFPNPNVQYELQQIIKNRLNDPQITSDQRLRDLFANPALRLGEVQLVYGQLASNPAFIATLRQNYEEYLETASPEQKQVFLSSTGFDSLDEVVKIIDRSELNKSKRQDVFLDSPTSQSATAVETITGLTIDGARQFNFEMAAEAVALAMGSKEVANHLGLEFPESKADLENFIKKLDVNRLAMIFFADPNNPNVVDDQTLNQISSNLEQVKAVLVGSLNNIAINAVLEKATALKQALGLADASAELPPEELGPTIASIQTLTNVISTSSSKDEAKEALTTDKRKSHTQELMEGYQRRIRGLWERLDDEQQLEAYSALFNIEFKDENRKELLDKVKHLRDPNGKLPWTSTLFVVVGDWELFVRKSNKALRLYQAAEAQNRLRLIDAARQVTAQGFLEDLTPVQVDQLRRTALIQELDEATTFAQQVLRRYQKGEYVSDLEYRGAVTALLRVKNRVDAIRLLDAPVSEQGRAGWVTAREEIEKQAETQLPPPGAVSTASEKPDVQSRLRTTTTADRAAQQRREQLPSSPSLLREDRRFERAFTARIATISQQQTELLKTLSALETAERSLTFAQTAYLTMVLGGPTILLPSEAQFGGQIGPGLVLSDDVTTNSVLPDVNSLSLSSLKQAGLAQAQLSSTKNQINYRQLASKAIQILAESKGNWVAAAGLTAKSILTDKDTQEQLKQLLLKAAQAAAGGFIAGTIILGTILQRLIGAVGPWGGAATGALAGGTFGFFVGGPIGAAIGGFAGGVAGYMAGSKLAALSAASGAELIPAQATLSTAAAATPAPQATGLSRFLPKFGTESATAQPTLYGSSSGGTMGGTAGQAAAATPTPAGAAAATQSQAAAAQAQATTAAQTASTTAAATPTAGTVAASTNPLFGLGATALIPGFALFSLAFLSMYTIYVIFSAFLVPLPIGDLTALNTTQSQYASLTKLASPSSLSDNVTADVVYKIVFQPRRNYRLRVTAVEDTANTGFLFQSNRPDHINPQVSPEASLINPRISIADFSPDFDAQTQTAEYIVTFSGGRKVLVSNTITITYDVQSGTGETIATGETIEATANVSIGDHGVACWPTTGYLTQLPGNSFTHSSADAYDIGSPLGTRVYSPFAGWAFRGDMGSSDYGKYVVVDSYVQGHWIRLLFGHLRSALVGESISDVAAHLAINHDTAGSNNGADNNVGQQVGAGQVIGTINSTGNSTGNHLHYELMYVDGQRNRYGDGGLSINNLIPQPPGGGTYTINTYVTTCFGQN